MSADTTSHVEEVPTPEITVAVNGEDVTREVEPRLKLSDFLRSECGCRGVRVGCEHGVCGACTVLVEDRAIKSCLSYAVQVEGQSVETVEGLADEGSLHPIQEAFREEHALQCGFCTSGFVMATKELLADNPDPDYEDVEAGLADNICRCTGYQNIVSAVDRAAEKMAASGDGAPADGDAAREGAD